MWIVDCLQHNEFSIQYRNIHANSIPTQSITSIVSVRDRVNHLIRNCGIYTLFVYAVVANTIAYIQSEFMHA